MPTVETRKLSNRLHAVQFDGSPNISTLLARINYEDDNYGHCDFFDFDNLDNEVQVRDEDYVLFITDEEAFVFEGLITQAAFIDLFDAAPYASLDFE